MSSYEYFDARRQNLGTKFRYIFQEINPKIKFEKDFSLETYHQYVNDDDHLKVINRTRSLFPADLDIDSEKIVANLSSYMETSLSYNNSFSNFILFVSICLDILGCIEGVVKLFCYRRES